MNCVWITQNLRSTNYSSLITVQLNYIGKLRSLVLVLSFRSSSSCVSVCSCRWVCACGCVRGWVRAGRWVCMCVYHVLVYMGGWVWAWECIGEQVWAGECVCPQFVHPTTQKAYNALISLVIVIRARLCASIFQLVFFLAAFIGTARLNYFGYMYMYA